MSTSIGAALKDALQNCPTVKVTFLTPATHIFGDDLKFRPRAPTLPYEVSEPLLVVHNQRAGVLERLRKDFTCRNYAATVGIDGEKPRVTFYFCKDRKKAKRRWYQFFSACIDQAPCGLFDIEIFLDFDRDEIRFYCKPVTL